MADQTSGVDIKKGLRVPIVAPTPQNTPANPAPISSSHRPSIPTIRENRMENAFAGNPQLLNMLQGRLGSLVGKSSGYIDNLPKDVKRRINGLKYYQSKHAELEAKFQEEILVLEKKYAELYKPLYDKRAAVVTGATEPTDEEVAAGEKIDIDEEAQATEGGKVEVDDEKVVGVPEFWLTALKTHPQLSEFITPKDEGALKHLIDVRMSYIEKPGFKLEFEFSENPYFTNKVLTKTYYYQDQAGYGGDFVYDHAEGTEINWKKDKDLTVTVETKKQRHKGTNKVREVKRTIPAETFFTFFNPPQVPADGEELDEEEAEGLDEKLEADYELGEEFKEKIIPHAVDWFTGKALQYEDLEGDIDDYYDEEEEEDEDDEDDDEDDDDDGDAATH